MRALLIVKELVNFTAERGKVDEERNKPVMLQAG